MTAEDANKKIGLVIAAIGLSIAVVSIIAALAVFSEVASWFAESDTYVRKINVCDDLLLDCNYEGIASIPVGSVVSISFAHKTDRMNYIGGKCKLDTVILGDQDWGYKRTYTLICETVKQRKATVLDR